MDLSPEWVQAIFAIILVIVTIAYAISTSKLAKASAKQIEYIGKENYRRVIVDILKNTYWLVNEQLESCKYSLEHGNLSSFLSPLTPYIKGQTRPPDEILKKYNEKFLEYSEKYDKLLDEGKGIINHSFKKFEIFKTQFSDLCHNLGKEDEKAKYGIDVYLNQMFACIIASSNLEETHDIYEFFIKNRDTLLKFLVENGFSEDMENYSQIKKELVPVIDNYLELLDNLFEEWKNEYNIIDSDFKEPKFGGW
ncbi:hypothetical protein F1737_01480 [Methanoplanus sp. FWC-SCC4]|uniref:DUF4760 domain-containing protein n=1 Tax=Methanochimaera problematica TaxID=2609417 RepID=A0AA97FA92_9EURY|nr:hypothetical protein [Methanoplanus sp. FWC-SCC4]WOF15442.1 hypothetical protein F1737_01480 [Methanoplanus sp. FWC-SCC4]